MYKINIKNLLAKSKFENLNQLATITGIQRSTLIKIYNGDTTKISLNTLFSLCKAFECTPNDIIVDDNNETSQTNLNQEISINKNDSTVSEELSFQDMLDSFNEDCSKVNHAADIIFEKSKLISQVSAIAKDDSPDLESINKIMIKWKNLDKHNPIQKDPR